MAAAATALRKAIAALDSELRDNFALDKSVEVRDVEGGKNADGGLVHAFLDPQNVTDGIVDSSAINANRTSLDSTQGNYLTIDLGKVYKHQGRKPTTLEWWDECRLID